MSPLKLMVLSVTFLCLLFAPSFSLAQEASRVLFLKSSFEKCVKSQFSDGSDKRLALSDFGRHSMGGIRHATKQIASNLSCQVRYEKNSPSFIECKANVKLSDVICSRASLEFYDLLPFTSLSQIQNSVEEAKAKVASQRDKGGTFNGGESRVTKVDIDSTGHVAFWVQINEQSKKDKYSEPWSSVKLVWAFVGKSESLIETRIGSPIRKKQR